MLGSIFVKCHQKLNLMIILDGPSENAAQQWGNGKWAPLKRTKVGPDKRVTKKIKKKSKKTFCKMPLNSEEMLYELSDNEK